MFGRGSRREGSREEERKRMIRFAQVVKSNNATVSTTLRYSVRELRNYGDKYYIIYDKSSSFDPWQSNPLLAFVSHEPAETYPSTELFETRHFLGSASMPQEKKIIVNHFQYGQSTNNKSVKFSIFGVNSDFSCSLLSEVSVDANDCAGSGLTGRFMSHDAGAYLSVWGDLSNNSYFSLGALKLSDATVEAAGTVAVKKLKPKDMPMGFSYLDEVYFAGNDAVYSSRAFPAGSAHPQHLVLQVYLTGTNYDGALSMPFHRVVILPFAFEPPEGSRFDSDVLQYRYVTDGDGARELFLVQVSLKQKGEKRVGSVTFLLKAPTNDVLDSYVSKEEEAVCCIASDNRSIVRVVQARGEFTFAESMQQRMQQAAQQVKAQAQETGLAPIPEDAPAAAAEAGPDGARDMKG